MRRVGVVLSRKKAWNSKLREWPARLGFLRPRYAAVRLRLPPDFQPPDRRQVIAAEVPIPRVLPGGTGFHAPRREVTLGVGKRSGYAPNNVAKELAGGGPQKGTG